MLRKIASDTQKAYHSRKASLPGSSIKSTLTRTFKSKDSDSDSIIALTTVETNKTYVNDVETGGTNASKSDKWNRESTYGGGRDDDPWSPTVTMGKASVQKVINVQMVNGRGSPAPQPQGRRYI
jgi:hypothetical protein